jgi:hypothetical protein
VAQVPMGFNRHPYQVVLAAVVLRLADCQLLAAVRAAAQVADQAAVCPQQMRHRSAVMAAVILRQPGSSLARLVAQLMPLALLAAIRSLTRNFANSLVLEAAVVAALSRILQQARVVTVV